MSRAPGFTHTPASRKKMSVTVTQRMADPRVREKMHRPRVAKRRQRLLEDLTVLLDHPVHGPALLATFTDRSTQKPLAVANEILSRPVATALDRDEEFPLAPVPPDPEADARQWGIYTSGGTSGSPLRVEHVPTFPVDQKAQLVLWASQQPRSVKWVVAGPYLGTPSVIPGRVSDYEHLPAPRELKRDHPSPVSRRKLVLKKRSSK